MITYQVEDNSPLSKYIFRFIFQSLGLEARESSKAVDIYYGLKKCGKVNITKNIKAFNFQQFQNQDQKDRDYIQAISFFLTDQANEDLPSESMDCHGRLMGQKSFQFRNQIKDTLQVNIYLLDLAKIITDKLSVTIQSLWPNGKKFAIGLSHDVDVPEKYAIFGTPFFNKDLSLRQNCLISARKIKLGIRYLGDHARNDFWLFEDIIKVEKKYGFKSTFFFASTNRRNGGYFYDVDYDIFGKNYQKIFTIIKQEGFEIGLHAGYLAYKKLQNLGFEKKALEKASKIKINGLRHHYWHLGEDIDRTLLLHEKAKFKYDSSLAYNDEIGFRRSVALPFKPWSPSLNREIQTWQMPVFLMDGNLLYQTDDISKCGKIVANYLDMIEQFNGLGVIDWHVNTSLPLNRQFRHWGKLYLKILKLLSKKKSCWVTDLGTINKHLECRTF